MYKKNYLNLARNGCVEQKLMWRGGRRRLSKNMNKILFTIHKALNPVSNHLIEESNREGLWWTLPQQLLH